MIHYRDMTFCEDWRGCRDGAICYRALTNEVLVDAKRSGLMACHFMCRPSCYVPKKENRDEA